MRMVQYLERRGGTMCGWPRGLEGGEATDAFDRSPKQQRLIGLHSRCILGDLDQLSFDR